MIPMLFAGALAGAMVVAPSAQANPDDCVNPDGTACATVGADSAAGGVPGGPVGQAGPGGAAGAIPGGPSGAAGPQGAAGCIPGLGCLSVPVG